VKRSRFTEEQIIGVLKEHELGAKTADLCRKHGISEATFYNWKSKFGGMDVSEARRLKALETAIIERYRRRVPAWNGVRFASRDSNCSHCKRGLSGHCAGSGSANLASKPESLGAGWRRSLDRKSCFQRDQWASRARTR